MHAAHVVLRSAVAQYHGMVMRSLDQPHPIIIRLSEGEDCSHPMLTDASLTTDLPSDLRIGNLATTKRQASGNLVSPDSVDPMRCEGIADALTTAASGGRAKRNPDGSSANHWSNLSFFQSSVGV
jgi:hypothetical protein